MSKYIMRLDDACEKRDIRSWDRMEALLDEHGIKPLVGVIPHCEDPKMDRYAPDGGFWRRVDAWREKGWTIAMHGFNHVYGTACGGINPVNHRSEFAGESLAVQRVKVRRGIQVFRGHGLDPKVFFAPSHTFDMNTLGALVLESNIRIISDTVANDAYTAYGFMFVPQQSGRVRPLPFKTVTFCYHPNSLEREDFDALARFLRKHGGDFTSFPTMRFDRKKDILDRALERAYLARKFG